ncbi:hypothetical protein K7T73_15910 [Bacillus badius]|uniref:hypothetical protein n=1 Tax=Bacillus badius TaxID=1455 RepID=UPI001CBB1E22|nr:hypothetical protein [Bacillus badius]UAT30023.1 hypothetical protein K7T73_15910 [Bacillus badius]
MHCIYTVRWYGGCGTTYRERADKDGYASAFYPGGTAHITYNVKVAETGGFLLSYEVKTVTGEVVAVNQWQTKHESKHTAAMCAIEEACHAAGRYDSIAMCLIGDKPVNDVLVTLKAKETRRLKELEAV